MIVVYRLKQLVVGDCGSYDDTYQASILDSDFMLLYLVRFEILWNFVRPASCDKVITIWNPFTESIYGIHLQNRSMESIYCVFRLLAQSKIGTESSRDLTQYISGVVMIAII